MSVPDNPRLVLAPLLVCCLCLAALAASAQETPERDQDLPPEVVLELKGQRRPLIRLAFPEIDGSAGLVGSAAKAANELEATLRSDLEGDGRFDIQGPWAFASLELTGNLTTDYDLYRSVGNEFLLAGRVRTEEQKLVFEGRLIELRSGDAILAKRYRGRLEMARRIAHTFADQVILFLSGRSGISLTRIAFASDRSGFKEIFVMDYDGHDQRRITGHRSISMAPDWSPDLSQVAYLSYFSGRPGIYLADVASGRKHTFLDDGQHNVSPSFSPDGRQIAFARSMGGSTQIFVADRDGRNLRRLTHSRAIDTNPVWSPSGRAIALTSSRVGNPHIYVMDAEGTNLRRITFEGNYNDGVAWHPDGDRVAYASRRKGGFEIALTDVVTLETRVLTSGPGNKESPSFSPDGRRITFTTSHARPRGRETQIFIMDADGSHLKQLTQDGNNFSPAWSKHPR
jgi:TolB protein